ncbi:MAG: PHP domain-containing protein [Clostridia bacterium]|nr:PHP domain-containing protein [Clostridia bacterium]MDD4386529.1 PHP domain-containing protein [Clostridia bacterium]
MVDMHIHTVHSDGIDSIQKVFEFANKLNISPISITDHNTISAYEEIIKTNVISLYNGDLIPGVELKCHINKEIIELLVYDFDIYKMKKFINQNYHEWEYINKNMSIQFENILINRNICYDKNIMLSYDFNKYNGIMELYKSVIQIESNEKKLCDDLYKDIPKFFRDCVCNENSKYYVDLRKYYPSVESITNFVKQNGGKIFIPHVYFFKHSFNILKQIHEKYMLDGVECYHPSYTLEQCNELLNYCKNNNLYISAGSDYHGDTYGLGNSSDFYDDNNIKLFDFKNKMCRK